MPLEAELWNKVCGRISKVQVVGNGRLRHLQTRRKDAFWVEHYEEALAKVAASSFCNGTNDRGWRATFDWLVERPDALAKVVEGKYDDRAAAPRRMKEWVPGSSNL